MLLKLTKECTTVTGSFRVADYVAQQWLSTRSCIDHAHSAQVRSYRGVRQIAFRFLKSAVLLFASCCVHTGKSS